MTFPLLRLLERAGRSPMWPALLLLCAMAANGQERIVSFHSDIRIAAYATMEVTETIRVRAEGQSIRRGIFREIPTRYRDRFGNAFNVDLDVIAVTRDGLPEPWSMHRRANGIRIDLGDDSFLQVPAEYEYAIHYRSDRQVGYFDDHDELYWNVTGNGWAFVIEDASATVTLPVTLPDDELAIEGYTGRFGESGQNYVASITEGEASISTTSALAPAAGLTLVLSWPKGIVEEPEIGDRVAWLLSDNRGLLLALLTLAGVFLYLWRSWARAGRDPAPGVIFPHYNPPEGYSPAAARYIMKMGYDTKVLTAAVINLAVKGYLRITQQGKKFSLQRLPGTERIAAGEQILLDRLFATDQILELTNKNHAGIASAMHAHAKSLKQAHKNVYFANNAHLLLPSALGSLLMLLLIIAVGGFVPLVIVIFIAIVLLHLVFVWLLKAPTATGRRLMDKLEGFKLYLDVAEKDDMNSRNPPTVTPELFERFLPFAIALGVEQAWADKLAASMAGISQKGSNAYHPLWYAGQFNVAQINDFTTTVGTTFASAISSASQAPGTSSGSGGGGFSGGGGGGGGGGGR